MTIRDEILSTSWRGFLGLKDTCLSLRRGRTCSAMAPAEPSWRASVTARLNDARRKNGRLGSKKVKSGCITCKARKVKCDEQKPHCQKCLSLGRTCEGYQDSPAHSPPLLASPSQMLQLGKNEKRSYEFFLSFAAPRLAGSLDKVRLFIQRLCTS